VEAHPNTIRALTINRKFNKCSKHEPNFVLVNYKAKISIPLDLWERLAVTMRCHMLWFSFSRIEFDSRWLPSRSHLPFDFHL